MKNITKNAFVNVGATAAYIAAIATFLFYGTRAMPKQETVLIPIMMLMLFVFSAALVGTLIFGRPILLYLDGKKKDALSLLSLTLALLLVLTLAAILALLLGRA